MGSAIETKIESQTEESAVGERATMNGMMAPSMMAPGQKDRVWLCETERAVLRQIQWRDEFGWETEGVSHGSPR